MTLDEFLSRLEKVRKSGNGYIACCPAHEDRSPSLSVGQGRNGGIVVQCYAGCSFESIVEAVGAKPSDLMPPDLEPSTHFVRGVRFDARTALEALAYQSMIVAVAAADMCRDKPLSVEDKDKLFEIAANINRTLENVTGRARR